MSKSKHYGNGDLLGKILGLWISISVITLLIVSLIYVLSPDSYKTNDNKFNSKKDEIINKPSEPQKSEEVKYSIDIKSQIAKKNGDKYDYYFDIRNSGNSDFSGEVKIELYSTDYKYAEGVGIIKIELLKPGRGISGVVGSHNAPVGYQQIGIATFKYEVIKDKNIIANGSGDINLTNSND